MEHVHLASLPVPVCLVGYRDYIGIMEPKMETCYIMIVYILVCHSILYYMMVYYYIILYYGIPLCVVNIGNPTPALAPGSLSRIETSMSGGCGLPVYLSRTSECFY